MKKPAGGFNLIHKINDLLHETIPFVLLIALVYGVMGAWLAAVDLVPFLKQLWSPKGTAQSHAIVGACLAIIATGIGSIKR